MFFGVTNMAGNCTKASLKIPTGVTFTNLETQTRTVVTGSNPPPHADMTVRLTNM